MDTYTVYPHRQYSVTTDSLDTAVRMIANAGGGMITTLKPLPPDHPHAPKTMSSIVLNVIHIGEHPRIEGGTMYVKSPIAGGDTQAVELWRTMTA